MLKLPIQEEHVSVRRTYLLLMKALLDLLAEMPFEKISLTDICRVSMVSRSTFYRYFEDKYDLLHYCIKMYIEGLRPVEDFFDVPALTGAGKPCPVPEDLPGK